MGEYRGISRWTLNAIACMFLRGSREKVGTDRRGESDVTMNAKIGMIWIQAKEGQQPQEA